MMKRKQFAALLAAIAMTMCTVSAPVSAIADVSPSYDDLIVEPLPPKEEIIHEGNLTFTIYTDNYSQRTWAGVTAADSDAVSVTIPASFRDVPVEYIQGGAFHECTSLQEILVAEDQTRYTSIDGVLFNDTATDLIAYPLGKGERYTVPEKTQTIKSSAFLAPEGFDGLKEISFPGTLLTIGWNAFQNNAGLTSVTLPDSCKNVEVGAFQNCTGLESVHIGKNARYLTNAFDGCTSLCKLTGNPTDFKIIDNVLFTKYDYLNLYPAGLTAESYTVPDGTERIIQGAFQDCAALKEVILPDSLTGINDTFQNLPALESLTIPEGVTSIGNIGINCPALTTLYLPSTLTYTGYSMLRNTPALTDIYYNGTEEEFGNISNTWNNTAIHRTGVFMHYAGEEEFRTFTSGDFIFKIFSDHAEVASYMPGPNDVVRETLVIPDEADGVPVTVICGDAFRKTSGFCEVELPDTVTRIGSWAFSGCTSMTSIRLPEGLETIGERAFSYSGLTEIDLPPHLTQVGSAVFQGTKLTEVTIPEGYETVWDHTFMGCTLLETVSLPQSLTAIGGGAFFGCKALTEITLPEGITTLEGSAFSNAGLKSINLPESITEIGAGCFNGCSNLRAIELPEKVETLKNEVFCSSGLTSLTIPATVTSIEGEALCKCSHLESVTILNPDCEIDMSVSTICTTYMPLEDASNGCIVEPMIECLAVIYGWKGSTAEEYATQFNVQFTALDDIEMTEATEATEETAASTTEDASEHPQPKCKGDLDGDGDVSLLDVVLLNKSLMVGTPLTEAQREAADVNHDGKPDFDDALAMLKYVVEIITYDDLIGLMDD